MAKKIVRTFLVALILLSAQKAAARIAGHFRNETLSDYITMSGGKIGEGGVNQTILAVEINSWHICGFYNFDFLSKQESEHDLGFGKKFADNKFSLDLSYQQKWLDGCQERAFEVKSEYNCPVKLSCVWTKVISEGLYYDWNRFYCEILKPFAAGAATFSPMLGTAYLNNYYAENGWAHITGGLSLEYSFMEKICFSSVIKYQEGLLSTKDSLFYGGVGIKLDF